MRRKISLLTILLLIAIFGAIAQTPRYVTTTGAGSKNGLSWASASDNLQATVNAAVAGDTVFVAAGTYTGGFIMKDGVQVYGGFSGVESNTTGSKPSINLTVLDGGDTQRVLTQSVAFTYSTVWSGFTLQKGMASLGAGSYLMANGILRNCIITANKTNVQNASKGGGAYLASGAQLQGCLVNNNESPNASGVYLASSNAKLLNSTVANNKQSTTPQPPAAPTWKVGDVYPKTGTPEGIVFWVDPTGEHGWTVALKDNNNGVQCSWGTSTYVGTQPYTNSTLSVALSDTTGFSNTGFIRAAYPISIPANANYAANKVDFPNGWYLPAVGQLRKLSGVLPEINAALSVLGANATTISYRQYWSSTGYAFSSSSRVWAVDFDNGEVTSYDVNSSFMVRSVRAF